MSLSQSLEDYLEAIWIIGLKEKTVRVKDLMNYFNYKVSSINQALKTLSKKQYIHHEKYGYIDLTQKGMSIAQGIYEKHKTLSSFFNHYLGIKTKIAVNDACNVEHYISEETYNSLLAFVEYLKEIDFSVEKFYEFKKQKKQLKGVRKMFLNELKIGEKGKIKKIEAPASIKQKLLSMGVIPNEIIEVEKVSLFDGPIEIKIKGYNLSLRKKEAEMIVIEEIK